MYIIFSVDRKYTKSWNTCFSADNFHCPTKKLVIFCLTVPTLIWLGQALILNICGHVLYVENVA